MSSHRQVLFERGSEYDQTGKKFRSHYLIRCSNCQNIDNIRFNRYTKSLPPDLIAKQFHQKGWAIGSSRANDLCPQCILALTSDRQKRKEVSTLEKHRAERDLVIAEAKAPEATHPPVSDNVDLSRRQLVLLDRTSELYRKSAYITTMLETLMDQVAELEKEREAIIASISAAKEPVQPGPQEAQPMFQPIAAKLHPAAAQDYDAVRVGHYVKGSGPITIITMSQRIAGEAGIVLRSRVRVLEGDGEDAGVVKIEPIQAEEDEAGYVVGTTPSTKGHCAYRIASSLLRPSQEQHIPMTVVKHKVADGALFLRLPQQFVDQPTPAAQ